MNRITAYIGRDTETGLCVGIVPGIPCAHTQAESLDELQANLKEVLELCLKKRTLRQKGIYLSLPVSSKSRCWSG